MGSMNVMPEYYNYFHLTTTKKSLNTAISYAGGCFASIFAGFLVDWRGRRESIFWSALILLIGAIIQTAAQNVGMFIAGRFIIGIGMGYAATATPTYVAEAAPPKHRAFALGLPIGFQHLGMADPKLSPNCSISVLYARDCLRSRISSLAY